MSSSSSTKNIVERLRHPKATQAEMEAAAEIERLQVDVVHWREARRMCLAAGDMMKAEIEQLRDEIKRLRAALISLRSAGGWVRDVIDLELNDNE